MLPVMRNSWMPEVFNNFLIPTLCRVLTQPPQLLNVKETEHDYTVELAAAGMKKDDFNINIDADGNLHIKMEKKNEKKEEEKKEHYLRREFSYTKFEQTLLLPDDVDKEKIAANVSDGVLTIDLPKVEQNVQKAARQIEVK